MDSPKLIIKLFAANDVFAPAEFVPVFHRIIQQHALPDHMLIDVADYAHVPDGPGSLLVSSEANIHMDRNRGQLGLLYVRKQPFAGATSFADNLRATLAAALGAAALLESDEKLKGRLTFKTDELLFRINDRLAAPNTPATFDAVKEDLKTVFGELLGAEVTLAPAIDPETLFEVRVTSTGKSSSTVSDLLRRVETVAAK